MGTRYPIICRCPIFVFRKPCHLNALSLPSITSFHFYTDGFQRKTRTLRLSVEINSGTRLKTWTLRLSGEINKDAGLKTWTLRLSWEINRDTGLKTWTLRLSGWESRRWGFLEKLAGTELNTATVQDKPECLGLLLDPIVSSFPHVCQQNYYKARMMF